MIFVSIVFERSFLLKVLHTAKVNTYINDSKDKKYNGTNPGQNSTVKNLEVEVENGRNAELLFIYKM